MGNILDTLETRLTPVLRSEVPGAEGGKVAEARDVPSAPHALKLRQYGDELTSLVSRVEYILARLEA
jgi:hypothetical protein